MTRALLAALLAAVSGRAQAVDPSTLNGKVLFGYQGWFRCPAGGTAGTNWSHWASGTPSASTLAIDMYPDLREFDADELCAVPNMSIGARPAYLFSAGNSKTVARHFRWMQQYGLDGVLVQRFVTDIAGNRAAGDPVLKNAMAGAERYGRTFAVEYDVTGANPATVVNDLQQDWGYLVNTLKLTASSAYLHHNGKPVLSVWGLGFSGGRNPPENPAVAGQLVQWFLSTAGVTYIGGTPSQWRTLTSDSLTDPGWTPVYRMMDVIQPWTVGRYSTNSGADAWAAGRMAADFAATAQSQQIYMPVIFPGFSWHNLNPTAAANQIPRNRGEFLWRQAYNARAAGAQMLKIAMFDEVNESTAVFKIASRRGDAPDQGYWLTLDADGFTLPSDWYLRLAGEIARAFHGQAPLTPAMPASPGPPWSSGAVVLVVNAASFQAGELAAESLATAMGTNLAAAQGTEVWVIDSTGASRPAPLTYVSPTQVNFQVAGETAMGPATVTVASADGTVTSGALPIGPVAPGIFSAAGNGQGAAAAVVRVAHPDGTQTSALTFSCAAAGSCAAVPVNLGVGGDQAFLELYGTGIRGRTSLAGVTCMIGGTVATVQYAGSQSSFPGLDQVNVVLPRSLAGAGEVAAVMTVDGHAANAVTVNIH